MEYHSDRFEENSLLIFKQNKLVALLPANKKGKTLYSHQGLSYGGFVFSKKIKFKEALLIIREALSYLNSNGIDALQIKVLPRIYHGLPADEIDAILFLTTAKLVRTDISSSIDLQNKLNIQPNRIEGVKKAERNNLEIIEGTDFKGFWNDILIPNLHEKHSASPVHSLEEIEQLAQNFPHNIRQFNVFYEKRIVAGATIFETKNVAHVQYISANNSKQQLGSLDYLFYELISKRYADKKYFDFGISNENQGKNINEGLLYWKECFGARTTAQQFYEVETVNYTKLDSVFI